jgi:hypothetical protein
MPFSLHCALRLCLSQKYDSNLPSFSAHWHTNSRIYFACITQCNDFDCFKFEHLRSKHFSSKQSELEGFSDHLFTFLPECFCRDWVGGVPAISFAYWSDRDVIGYQAPDVAVFTVGAADFFSTTYNTSPY